MVGLIDRNMYEGYRSRTAAGMQLPKKNCGILHVGNGMINATKSRITLCRTAFKPTSCLDGLYMLVCGKKFHYLLCLQTAVIDPLCVQLPSIYGMERESLHVLVSQ